MFVANDQCDGQALENESKSDGSQWVAQHEKELYKGCASSQKSLQRQQRTPTNLEQASASFAIQHRET